MSLILEFPGKSNLEAKLPQPETGFARFHPTHSAQSKIAKITHKQPEGSNWRNMIRTWRWRIQDRSEIRRSLLLEPDSVLQDLGVSRAALKAEADKPFWRG